MVNTFTTLTTALPLVFSHLLLFLSLFSSLSLPFSLIFQYSPLYLPPLYHFLSCLHSSFPPYYSYSTHKSFLSFFPLHPVSPFSLPPLSPFLFFSLLPILYLPISRKLNARSLLQAYLHRLLVMIFMRGRDFQVCGWRQVLPPHIQANPVVTCTEGRA